MYFKSRMFKFIMLTLILILIVFGVFYVKGNSDKFSYNYTKRKDLSASTKYVSLNNGKNYTNSLDVQLKVANDDIEVNYISYMACYDDGKTHCNDWSETIYIGDKLGIHIDSEDVWSKNITLYKGELDIENLQGRHFVKVRYISRTEIMGLSIKIIDTKTAYIYVDTFAPTINPSLRYEWTTKDSITISYKDKEYSPSYMNSGVSSINYSTCVSFESNADGTYTCNSTPNLVEVKTNSKNSFSIPIELKKTLVNVIIKDKAGNSSTWSQVIKMDEIAPTININLGILSDLNNAGSIVINANDEDSKIRSLSYVFTSSASRPSLSKFTNQLDNFSNVNIDLPTENDKYYLWVFAEDYAGNTTYVRSDYFYVCDDDMSCSKIQPAKKDYSIILYISVAAALVACIGIVTIMNKRKKKLSSND